MELHSLAPIIHIPISAMAFAKTFPLHPMAVLFVTVSCKCGLRAIPTITQCPFPLVRQGPCPVGRYLPFGSPYCILCDPGSFSDTIGATECTPCPAGYTSNSARSACESCPPGEISGEVGAEYCSQHAQVVSVTWSCRGSTLVGRALLGVSTQHLANLPVHCALR